MELSLLIDTKFEPYFHVNMDVETLNKFVQFDNIEGSTRPGPETESSNSTNLGLKQPKHFTYCTFR
jgi:hypothetical protein